MASDLAAVTREELGTESTLDPPVIGREVMAVAIWTLLADLLIFRTYGYSGPAFFLALAPGMFAIGCPGLATGPARKLTIGLILLVAARLAWAGSGLTVFSAIVLIVALAMSAAGHVPYVLESFMLAGRAIVFGAKRLTAYRFPNRVHDGSLPTAIHWVTWLLPVAAVFVFAAIFVLANPDLFDWVSQRLSRVGERLQIWLADVSVWELPFCIVALMIGVGLMRPVLPIRLVGPIDWRQSSYVGHAVHANEPSGTA